MCLPLYFYITYLAVISHHGDVCAAVEEAAVADPVTSGWLERQFFLILPTSKFNPFPDNKKSSARSLNFSSASATFFKVL